MTCMRRVVAFSSGRWAVLFVLSLICLTTLRFDAVTGKSMKVLLDSGIGHGILLDAVVASLLTSLYLLASAYKPLLGLVIYLPLMLLTFLLTLGDLLYFRFFGSPLKLWVIRNHLSDIGVVGGSAVSLGFRPLILCSLVALVAALMLAIKLRGSMGRRGSLKRALVFLPILVITFYAHQFQFSNLMQVRYPLLYPNNEFRISGNLSAHSTVFKLLDELDPKKRDRLEIGLKGGEPQAYDTLVEFQKLGNLETQAAPEQVLQWRKTLGLDPNTQPNFIVVFVESLRGYEFFHPLLGPKIFPHSHRILKEHGWLYNRAYTSALTAGQTVRGVYASLCSAFPNLLGAAPHLAYPEQDIECLQKLLQRESYQTAWIVPHPKSFHNKATFEEKQNTEVLLDRDSLDPDATKQRFELGIVDHEFFNLFVESLEKNVDPQKPFFVHTINVGTHHPWGPIPIGLPRSLKPENSAIHSKFMSRLKYWDYSFGVLFDKLSKKTWMKNTVLVLVADHSMRDASPPNLNAVQAEEMSYRIPLAFITLGLKPRTFENPVHQFDIAPTLAALAGAKPPKHFLGHNLMRSNEGSPWVYTDGRQEVSYRFKGKSCYYFSSTRTRACYRNDSTHDPLFDLKPEEVSELKEEKAFFEKVVAAEHMMHGLNAWTRAFQ